MLTLVPQGRLLRTAILSLYLAVCAGLFGAAGDWLSAAARFPQDGSQQPAGVLRSKVTLQTVVVQVTDKHGNRVRGLTAQDFTVREDGQRQRIAFFDAGASPVTVAVLVDSSVSMSQHSTVGSAGEVAAQFARIARPGDDIYMMDFTSQSGPFEHLAAAELRNPGLLALPSAGGSGSALFDAIATATCHLGRPQNPRQAIVVITDGIDEYSRLTLNRLIDAVRTQPAQLFLIGFESKKAFRDFDRKQPTVRLWGGHDIDNPFYVSYRLAKEAGASTFFLNSKSTLRSALQAVSDTLNAEYTLAYYPPPTRRKVRHIQVRVDRRGVRVQASRTVVSNPNSGEAVEYLPGTCVVSPVAYPHPYEPHMSGTSGAFVYRDDFSDPESGWPIEPEMFYVAEGYELSNWWPGTEQYQADVIAVDGPPGPTWANFRVSATVRFQLLLGADAQPNFVLPVHPAAGLVFRLSWQGYYALLVRPSNHPKELAFELVARRLPGDFRGESVIVPWATIVGYSRREAQLAVEDVGGKMALFIDGQLAASVFDNAFDNGYDGFIVDGSGRAIFSHFVLEQK